MDGSKLARDLLPPLLYRALTAVNPNAISLVGPYADWAAAVADSQGYDAAAIVEQVERAQDRVLAGAASFERDSVLFQDPQYNCPLMALLLRAALENEGRLSVLDFGGARNPDSQGFAAFGRVVDGMELVREIHTMPANGQILDPPLRIQRAVRVH